MNRQNQFGQLYFERKALAEEALRTKSYAPWLDVQKQDFYIIKYLRDQKLPIEEAKAKWEEVASGHWNLEPEDLDGLFWSKWRKSGGVRWNEARECTFYQEDFDALKGTKLKPWEKKMVLLMKAQFELAKIDHLWNLDFTTLLPLIERRADQYDERNVCHLINAMITMGWLTPGFTKEEEDDFYEEPLTIDDLDFGEEEEEDEVKIKDEDLLPNADYFDIHLPKGEHPITTVHSVYEAVKTFNYITEENTCPVCGKLFIPSARARTNLCPECYKEARKKAHNEVMRKKRGKD